jgi:hypothetical protein
MYILKFEILNLKFPNVCKVQYFFDITVLDCLKLVYFLIFKVI